MNSHFGKVLGLEDARVHSLLFPVLHVATRGEDLSFERKSRRRRPGCQNSGNMDRETVLSPIYTVRCTSEQKATANEDDPVVCGGLEGCRQISYSICIGVGQGDSFVGNDKVIG